MKAGQIETRCCRKVTKTIKLKCCNAMEGGCRMLVDIDAEYIVESERIVRSNYDLSENMMG